MSEGNFDIPNKVGEYHQFSNPAEIRKTQIERELAPIQVYYGGKDLPPLDPIGEYQLQTNPGVDATLYGGTCSLASAGNALRALGLYDPLKHSEERFVDYLGGKKFLEQTNGGAGHEDIAPALENLVSGIAIKGSISAYEILRAVENGAAAVIGVGAHHAGAIYPGSRVAKDREGNLSVQVVDPGEGIKMIKMRDFVRHQIPITYPPSWNTATIIKRINGEERSNE